MSARDYALFELDAKRLPGWEPGLLKHSVHPPKDPRDRALAEQISIGVVKNLLHLQFLLSKLADRSLKQIDVLVQKIVVIGLYQMRFLTRIPASAAVNEAVNQAKRLGRSQAAGFVNAVLRNATRAAVAFPERGAAWEHAHLVLSHPPELFDRLTRVIGPEDALRVCEHDNAEPPTIVRLYPGRSAEDLAGANVTVTPHERAGFYIIDPARPALLADLAERFVAQVQDPTAALAVEHLDVRPGQAVLDRCAGLGTKTLQVAARLNPTDAILAMDPSEPRFRMLEGIVARRHLRNITVRRAGMMGDLDAADPKAFDRILIDAPCSNSGVLARRPEARYHQDAPSLASLAKLQDRILGDTAKHLKPGGKLVYSTCSIWAEENQQRVAGFLKACSQFRLVEERTTLPSMSARASQYHDGGYFAVLTV
jgi:16S rRNA (cytosine967-C5)-methyltransferase